MRILIVKWAAVCTKCGAELAVGTDAAYEKRTGIFCPACAPTDPEEIREYRQQKADAKAERYQSWAVKRREKAAAVFKRDEWARGDIAFCTQPGHIPGRTQMISRHERQFESLQKADEMEEKAASLRHVVVKGDAARRTERERAGVLTWLKVGMLVYTPFSQVDCEVLKINKKTVKLRGATCDFNERIEFVRQIKKVEETKL